MERHARKRRALWMAELERWLDDEPEREDIVVITVTPRVVAYWNVEDAGERALA